MEIAIWRCEYKATCSAHGCTAAADRLVRHLDEQGRFIRQDELCAEHAGRAVAAGGAEGPRPTF